MDKRKERIIKDFEPLLITVANEYKIYFHLNSDDVEDLINEGRIGVWRAVDKYDPEKGHLNLFIYVLVKQQMKKWLKKHVIKHRVKVAKYENYKRIEAEYLQHHDPFKEVEEKIDKVLNEKHSRLYRWYKENFV